LLDLAPLLARRPGYAFRLLSHKLARYLVPLHLLVILACSVMLAPGGPLFLALLGGQAVFYALAAAGWRLSHAPRGRNALVRVPFYFILMNLAAAIATAELLRGRRRIAWTRPADLYTPPALQPSPR
jgi:hypothetical protein